MNVNSPWIWRFLKSTPLVFHIFIAVAVVDSWYTCGRHDIGPSVACRQRWIFSIVEKRQRTIFSLPLRITRIGIWPLRADAPIYPSRRLAPRHPIWAEAATIDITSKNFALRRRLVVGVRDQSASCMWLNYPAAWVRAIAPTTDAAELFLHRPGPCISCRFAQTGVWQHQSSVTADDGRWWAILLTRAR